MGCSCNQSPVSLYDRALFLAHGQDPRRFDLVVVKSPHCEPHMYSDWCGRLINVDGPARPAQTFEAWATWNAPGRSSLWTRGWSSFPQATVTSGIVMRETWRRACAVTHQSQQHRFL